MHACTQSCDYVRERAHIHTYTRNDLRLVLVKSGLESLDIPAMPAKACMCMRMYEHGDDQPWHLTHPCVRSATCLV